MTKRPSPFSARPTDEGEPTRLMIDRADTACLRRVGGSRFDRFNDMLISQTIAAQWEPAAMAAEDRAKRREAVLLGLVAFDPRDEVEGMLAAQAMALHAMTMELSRRAMLAEQPSEIAAGMRKAAIQASRGFAEVAEALDRRRGKGRKQSIVVKHMHLTGDARAMIGNFTTGGGGDGKGTEGEPHAPPARLAHDPAIGAGVPAVRGADTGRAGVPRAFDKG